VVTLHGRHMGIVSDLRILDCYYSYEWLAL
jgi:hypothetical protein